MKKKKKKRTWLVSPQCSPNIDTQKLFCFARKHYVMSFLWWVGLILWHMIVHHQDISPPLLFHCSRFNIWWGFIFNYFWIFFLFHNIVCDKTCELSVWLSFYINKLLFSNFGSFNATVETWNIIKPLSKVYTGHALCSAICSLFVGTEDTRKHSTLQT